MKRIPVLLVCLCGVTIGVSVLLGHLQGRKPAAEILREACGALLLDRFAPRIQLAGYPPLLDPRADGEVPGIEPLEADLIPGQGVAATPWGWPPTPAPRAIEMKFWPITQAWDVQDAGAGPERWKRIGLAVSYATDLGHRGVSDCSLMLREGEPFDGETLRRHLASIELDGLTRAAFYSRIAIANHRATQGGMEMPGVK